MSSFPINLIADALLRLNNDEKLLPAQVDALRAYVAPAPAAAPAAAETAAAETAAAETAAPVETAAAETAAVTTEAKAKKPRKAKTVKTVENELLMPVDATATATVTATATAPMAGAGAAAEPAPMAGASAAAEDPLCKHSRRLTTVDAALWRARKIDEKNPIVGTRKDDDGSNGMFYPEKQCSKKPVPGQKLCATCAKKQEGVKTTDKTDKTWYGRLDEPMFWNAKVVGCKHYFDKYPEGIKGDPTSRAAAPVVVASKPAAAKKLTAKKAAEPVAVADTSAAPKEVSWITMLIEGKPHIRSTKNGNVYVCDLSKTTREESVVADNFVGRWEEGALNKFAEEADEE